MTQSLQQGSGRLGFSLALWRHLAAIPPTLYVTFLTVLPCLLLTGVAVSGTPRAGSVASPMLGQPSTTQAQSGDCRNLRIMERLARIAGPEDLADQVASKRQAVCSAGGDPTEWLNGKTAKRSEQSWDYPNGKTAKRSEMSWDYPNGKTAKRSARSWDYPNGKTAKRSESLWDAPDGKSKTREQLLAWACERVGAKRCEGMLANVKSQSADEQDLALIELAWLASLTPR